MSGPVAVDVGDGGVAVVTLDRPEVRNALDGEVLAALADAVLALDRDEGTAAVVLTGADPAFCAGFDLRQLSQRPGGGRDGAPESPGRAARCRPASAASCPSTPCPSWARSTARR